MTQGPSFALFRAVNVGKRQASKDQLRHPFAALGCTDVSTYIASGNVAFTTERTDLDALGLEAETLFAAELGFESEIFVRSAAELSAVGRQLPFGAVSAGHTLHVGFMATPPSAAVNAEVVALSNDVENLVVIGRELYWHVQGNFMASVLKPNATTKTLQQPNTMRNMNTVHKMVAKFL